MAFTNVWDDTVPADTQLANLLGSDLRAFRLDVQQRMAAISGSSGSKPTFSSDAQPANWSGMLFFATDNSAIYQFNGSTWAQIGSFGASAVNTQTASYTSTLTDANNVVVMNVATACTFTVPPNASVAYPIGTVLTVVQYGIGQVTLTPGSGVTFYNPSSLTTRTQYSTVALVQVASNVWVAGGDLT